MNKIVVYSKQINLLHSQVTHQIFKQVNIRVRIQISDQVWIKINRVTFSLSQNTLGSVVLWTN
jgi:hypothetical protein